MKTESVSIPITEKVSMPTTGIISKFVKWAEEKEPLRLFYMAAIIMIHANVVIPLTLWSMFASDAGAVQYMMITLLSFSILVSNLAVMPTKVTMSIFAVSTFILTLLGVYNVVVILAL